MQPAILIVDDQDAIRLFLTATLEARGYQVRAAADGATALALVSESPPDLVLLDLRLPDQHGLQVLSTIKDRWPAVTVVILTSFGQADIAVQAMKNQAFDFVTKPVNLDHLLDVIQRGLEAGEVARRAQQPGTVADLFAAVPGAVPCPSPSMRPVYDTVRKVAAGGRSTVLIQGESGVGKDVLVTLLHRISPRRDFPCLEINCASLPEPLLESELFGHERGAYTDAHQQKLGLLELAHGGTLFLDEIGEMPLAIQVKLLRVLEKMCFRRLGGLEDIRVDVRVVAATNRDLASLVEARTFRADLFYRLNVVSVVVPPLRHRQEDIAPLARHFLRLYNEEFGKRFGDVSEAALQALRAQPWPGNVRQLRNVVERSVLLADGEVLEAADLHLDLEESSDSDGASLLRSLERVLLEPLPNHGLPLDEILARLEGLLIRKALDAAGHNQSQAARLLGLGRDRLRYRLKHVEEGAP